MPHFELVPATIDDLEQLIRIQFEACASDPGFSVIFPNGASSVSVGFFVEQAEKDLQNDPTCSIMIVRDTLTGNIASFAIWHFYTSPNQEEIEKEMLADQFPLPADANIEAGNKLISKGLRRRHEIVDKWIGVGVPYAYLSAIGTSVKYQKQGAASMLLDWGLKRTDEQKLQAYVEGTPIGLTLYLKGGFREVDRLKLETAPWKEGDFYNVCMVRPSKAA